MLVVPTDWVAGCRLDIQDQRADGPEIRCRLSCCALQPRLGEKHQPPLQAPLDALSALVQAPVQLHPGVSITARDEANPSKPWSILFGQQALQDRRQIVCLPQLQRHQRDPGALQPDRQPSLEADVRPKVLGENPRQPEAVCPVDVLSERLPCRLRRRPKVVAVHHAVGASDCSRRRMLAAISRTRSAIRGWMPNHSPPLR